MEKKQKAIIGKNGYIDMNAIFEDGVNIYFILGQRADGKTYGVLKDCIEYYIETGVPSAYMRRFDESTKKHMIQDLCKPHEKLIAKKTGGEFTTAALKSKRFYLVNNKEEKPVTDKDPFLYCYSLNTWENSKGPDSGDFYTVIFDEAVSSTKYLPNEYSAFENMLSTIIRDRKHTRIVLLANPINQICPYFDEYNIDVHKLKPGDIVYRINSDGEKLKFVFVPPIAGRKLSSIFSFKQNSSIYSGYWEFGEFPRLPGGMIKESTYIDKFHVIFKKQFAVCEFYYKDGVLFTFWRPGNGDKIIDDRETVTFSDVHIFQPNIFTAWDNFSEIGKLYTDIVKQNRQYFADNKTGNLVKMWYQEFLQKAGRFV